jgi:hypothetical protein
MVRTYCPCCGAVWIGVIGQEDIRACLSYVSDALTSEKIDPIPV